MYQFSNSLIRQFPSQVTGNAAVGVQATVYVGESNTLASLFDVGGGAKSNPVTTDDKGFYSFSVADGDYRIVFSSSQFSTLRISVLDGAAIREDFDALVASNTAFRNEQQAAYDAFVLSQGWDQIGTFAAGFTFTSPNQVGQDIDGNWWRWNGAFPKIVTAGTLPSSDANYKLVGDGVLRNDLANGTADVGGVTSGQLAEQYNVATLPMTTCAHIAKRLSDGFDDDFACFGDSTMYGYLIGGATAQTQDPDNPPATFQKTLGHLYGYSGTVINAAISGTDMFNMMRGSDNTLWLTYEQRIAPGGVAASAVAIYCNHAINNCQQSLSIEQFEQDWIDFINITRKYGKVPVIVTSNPINPLQDGDPRESTQIEMYENAKRKIAYAMGVDLVDNYYYAKKSCQRYTESVLVPDGVHPSSVLYRQNGRNLALPLVTANVLRKEGDIASISGATYLDTQTSNIVRQDQTRTGVSYVGNRAASATGLNVAVVLDEPFEYLSFMALQFDAGARMQVGVQDNTSPWGFPQCGKVYGNVPAYKWDTDFVVKTDAMAGLNVLYWIFDITDTRPANNAAALSGFAVPAQSARSGIVPNQITDAYRKEFSVFANQSITVQHDFLVGGGAILEFVDASNQVTLDIKLNASSEMVVSLYNQGSVYQSTVISDAEPAGVKVVNLLIESSEITVSFRRYNSAIFVTKRIAIVDSVPPIVLALSGSFFTITPE